MKRCKMTEKKGRKKIRIMSNLIIIDIVSHSFLKRLIRDKFIDKLTIIHLTAVPL